MASTTSTRPQVFASGREEEIAAKPLPQLKELTVEKLFGTFKLRVPFPQADETNPKPSLIIIHGHNGVGKTRLLRMLDGFLRLDFDAFRKVPFSSCKLTFSTGEAIEVSPKFNPSILLVKFRGRSVKLNSEKPGAAKDEDKEKVEEFRKEFFAFTGHLSFQFIDAERMIKRFLPGDDTKFGLTSEHMMRLLQRELASKKTESDESTIDLAGKVKAFIAEAQLNYRAFFSSREPDLFPRILQHLTDRRNIQENGAELLKRLSKIKEKDSHIDRFGLEPDRWDYTELENVVNSAKENNQFTSALTALSAYIEVLESRVAERMLVAERLLTFERLMADFFEAKKVLVDSRSGLKIITDAENELTEKQLSSGEFHLLYLMVAALTTKRRGTIVAIDEPEMSMHISWQRKLVRALLTCASGAEPQFIFATHSPDIAAEFEEQMVKVPNE